MAEQCEHLAAAIDRPSWRIGIIPRVPKDPRTRPEFPQNAFDLHDEKSLVLGTSGGVAVTQHAYTVERHVALFARLEALAVFDEEAKAILRSTARDYRLAIASSHRDSTHVCMTSATPPSDAPSFGG